MLNDSLSKVATPVAQHNGNNNGAREYSRTVTPEELAQRLSLLKLQVVNGTPEYHGANPWEAGSEKDGFILNADGTAWDRKAARRYESREVETLAGLAHNEYEPCREYSQRNGATSGHSAPKLSQTPKASPAPETTPKPYDTRTLAQRGITPETMRAFGIVKKQSAQKGAYVIYPTFHPDGTRGRDRLKYQDPARAGKKNIWATDEGQGKPCGYGLERVKSGDHVVLVNGEVSVWSCYQQGITAVCTLGEANDPAPLIKVLAERGAASVRIVLDNDPAGRNGTAKAHRAADAATLPATAHQWPQAWKEGADASDLYEKCREDGRDFRAALEALPMADAPTEEAPEAASTRAPNDKGAELTPEEIRRIFREKAREYSEPLTLDEAKAHFKKWLYIEDEGLLEVYLGTIAANLMPGDPVWLMIVGASGGGKTEPLNAAIRLAFVHLAATVTESSLLSGTPKREKAKDAKGGLLREVGPFGLLLLKDFTSMLAQRRDASAAVLSAFREIYDGSWTRHVGSDGGTALHWSGKLGVIAGCTDTIDSHTAVIGTMGERFAFYRLPEVDDRKLSRHALRMAGQEAAMRDELSRAVCGLFAGLILPDSLPKISEEDLERLIDLASLTARCRSAVERDNHTRDITLTLSPEAPTRIAKILRQLFHGMDAIGVERPRIWAALEKIAFDSMHKVRRAVLKELEDGELYSTTKIAAAIQYPSVTARRALEELHAHDVLIRVRKAEGNSDGWQFSDWTAQTLAAVKSPKTGEEKSVPVFQTDDISFSSKEEEGENERAAEYMHPEKRERFQNPDSAAPALPEMPPPAAREKKNANADSEPYGAPEGAADDAEAF
jgi:hypothetical protein